MQQQGRYEDSSLRKMAYDLMMAHPDILKAMPPLQDILFVTYKENTPTSGGCPVFGKVSKVSNAYKDFLKAGEKTWVLEFYEINCHDLTPNKRLLLMMNLLLRFTTNEKGAVRLRPPEVQGFKVLLEIFPWNWETSQADVPDLLDPDFEWGRPVQRSFMQRLGKATRTQDEENPRH